MEFLDYLSDKNLDFALAITYLCLMTVFLVLRRIDNNKYMFTISVGYILAFSGYLALFFRGSIPIFLSVVAGNVFLISGEMIFTIGLFQLLGIKYRIKTYIYLLMLFIIIHIIYTYMTPSVNIRIINYSVFMTITALIFLFKSIKHILKTNESTLHFIWFANTIIIPYHLLRIINALGFEKIELLFRNSIVFKGYILLSIILVILKAGSIMIQHSKKIIEV